MTFRTKSFLNSRLVTANDGFDTFVRIQKVQEVPNYMINKNKHIYEELITYENQSYRQL